MTKPKIGRPFAGSGQSGAKEFTENRWRSAISYVRQFANDSERQPKNDQGAPGFALYLDGGKL